jgi:putative membrane protein insertion efficiency factor
MSRFLGSLLVGFIAIYRLAISPWLGRACRYEPSCSAYAQEAILLHGPVKGGWLAIRRLARCHPWGGSGWDPVPKHDHSQTCRHVSAG